MIETALLDNLESCLASIVPEDKHMGTNEIRGLFYAQMISPNKNNPLVWLSALFYGERPALSETQISTLDATAAAVHEAYNSLFISNQLVFPFDFENLDETIAEAALEWCQGFYVGLLIDEAFWFGKKDEKLKAHDTNLIAVRNSAKLFMCLITQDFRHFDRTKMAELKTLIVEQGEEPTVEMITAAMFPNVPMAVKTLQVFGTKAMLTKAAPKAPLTTDKVGRNDPCPCGSGKKYKKCCGSL